MRSKTVVTAVLAAALTVGLAACGASPTSGPAPSEKGASSNFDKINNLPVDKQYDEAVKLAKAEGEVTVYGSITPKVFDVLKEQFSKKYGIKVNDFRGKPEAIQQRVLQESSAGRAVADVIDTDFEQMAKLADKKLFVDYKGPLSDKVDDAGVFDGWIADRFDLMMPAWNTDIIKPGQEPHSWEDLADPKYNGKMTLDSSDSEWFGGLTHYWLSKGKSQSDIDTLWKDIAAGTTVTSGHSTMAELLSAGQVGMDAMNYSYLIDLQKAKGAPVTYRDANGVAPVPAFLLPFGLGMIKNSPHPAAAWLFTNWMLTKDGGQAAFADSSVLPSTELTDNPILKGVTVIPFPVQEVHAENQKYADAFDALLRGVPASK